MIPAPPFFCIAHQAFAWPLPSFMTVVGTGDHVPERGIAMSERFPELAFQNRYLGEYVALFAIRAMLLEAGAEGFVGFCHYRRFALAQPIGQLRGFNFHAHPDLLATLGPEAFYGDGRTPIIPAKVRFAGSVLCQFAAGCHTRDLMLFFADAIDCGVITDAESADFLSCDSFITAPTVAFIPVEWFLEIVQALETVTALFRRRHYLERPGYNARSMAFCCERLQALLLAKKADAWGWDRLVANPLTLLSSAT